MRKLRRLIMLVLSFTVLLTCFVTPLYSQDDLEEDAYLDFRDKTYNYEKQDAFEYFKLFDKGKIIKDNFVYKLSLCNGVVYNQTKDGRGVTCFDNVNHKQVYIITDAKDGFLYVDFYDGLFNENDIQSTSIKTIMNDISQYCADNNLTLATNKQWNTESGLYIRQVSFNATNNISNETRSTVSGSWEITCVNYSKGVNDEVAPVYVRLKLKF